jgi:hypothetical protein
MQRHDTRMMAMWRYRVTETPTCVERDEGSGVDVRFADLADQSSLVDPA